MISKARISSVKPVPGKHALLAAFSSDGNAWKGFDFEVDTKKKVLLSKTFFQITPCI